MQIVRKILTPDEISSPRLRYDATGDAVQMTPDNGTTWTDSSENDPRRGEGFLLPPLAGADPRCDAAANMVDAIRTMVDSLVDGMSTVSLANLIFSLVAVFLPLGVLTALVVIVADALLTVTIVSIQAAMTEGVYDNLLELIYCRLDAEGQLSADNFAALYVDVENAYPDTEAAGGFLLRFFDLIGEVGMSNAGASGSETGDCSGVGCGWCQEWDETAIYEVGSWTLGEGTSGSYTVTEISASFSAEVTLVEFDWEYRPNPGAVFEDGNTRVYDDSYPDDPIASEDAAPPPSGTLTFEPVDPYALTVVHCYVNSWYSSGGSNYPLITRVRMSGTGTSPAFDNGVSCL